MTIGRLRHLSTRAIRLAAAAVVIAAGGVAAAGRAWAAGSLTVTTCGADVFGHHAAFGINTLMYCPPGTNTPPGISILTGPNTVPAGERAAWEADAPAGLVITGASIAPYQMYSIHIDDGQGWGGGFYWAGGGAGTSDNTTQFTVSGLDSSYFGFQVICGWSSCNGNTHPAQLTVASISLHATETQGPWLGAPSGLWQASGWVRGTLAARILGQFAVRPMQRVCGAQRQVDSWGKLDAESNGVAPVRRTAGGPEHSDGRLRARPCPADDSRD